MISRKIFDTIHSPSITDLSPIHNNNPIFLNNKLSQAIRNQDDKKYHPSQCKDKDSQRLRDNERGTEEKNSFLLKSYDKYDNLQRQNHNFREQRSTVKQGYSRQRSDNKSRSNSPIFSNNNTNPPPSQILNKNQSSSLPSQYELLLQYELKREKQKNDILQKRLTNKEDFIKQMKNIQQDLTIAYARCQQELNQANTFIYELKTNSTKQCRDYKQQIQELKHQIAGLQNDLRLGNTNNHQPSRKHSIDNHSINNQSSFYYNDSFKKQIQVQKKYLKSKSTINLTRHKSNGQVDIVKIPSVAKKLTLDNPQMIVDFKRLKINHNDRHKNQSKMQQQRSQQQNSRDKDMVRSNTHSVLMTDFNKSNVDKSKPKRQLTPMNSQYSSISPNLLLENKHSNLLNSIQRQTNLSQFQVDIISQISKVSNFLQHFIDMCQKMMDIQMQQNRSPNNYDENQSKQKVKRQKSANKQNQKTKLIHELKKYWKWIKQVIRQWKDMKDQKKVTKSKPKRSCFNFNHNGNGNEVQNYQENAQHQETFQLM